MFSAPWACMPWAAELGVWKKITACYTMSEKQINVEFYGVLREVAGAESMALPLPDGSTTVSEFVSGLRERFPGLDRHLPRLAYALDDHLVRPDTELTPGSSLGLLPPVSGG